MARCSAIEWRNLSSGPETRPPASPGVRPHLVFRVPLAAGASSADLIALLEDVGITIVGIERDGAIIAFRDDVNLAAFRQAPTNTPEGRAAESTRRPADPTPRLNGPLRAHRS